MLSTLEQFNERVRRSVFFKMILVGILILLLLIPSGMITGLINERQFREQNVVFEVSSTWGNPQVVAGPFLMVPYQKVTNNEKGNPYTSIEHAYFLPDALLVEGNIQPEFRKRGIYEVLLYRSELTLKGVFSRPDFSSWKITPEQVLWKDAQLLLGLTDLRGIREGIGFRWKGENKLLEPGLPSKEVLESGAMVGVDLSQPGPYSYEIGLKLNGSNTFHIVPVGKETNVTLSGGWGKPSFTGAFLPDRSEITDDGFTGEWKVLHLNRNFPQKWQGSAYRFGSTPQMYSDPYQKDFYLPTPSMVEGVPSIREGNDASASAFGLRLLIPVDHYQKVERSAKYMILFVFLTFLVFFFVEVLNKKRIHPMQYLLVGSALLIFYLLLLSLSEYIIFAYAYFVGAAATIGLITLYSLSVFHLPRLSLLLAGILILLYGFLYILLQLEDYALLVGSIGLFMILAVIMFITRKIDWYSERTI